MWKTIKERIVVATDMSAVVLGCSILARVAIFLSNLSNLEERPIKNNKVICSKFPGCSSQLASGSTLTFLSLV
jgi:hypothetical protein